MAWPQEDRIRWVERRLDQRLAHKAGAQGLDPDRDGVPDEISLRIWLDKEREGLSWQQIFNKYFSKKGKGKTAGMSQARRCHEAVEKALSPPEKKVLRMYIEGQIRHLFHCTPEEFKRYLDSIPTRKRRKS